MNKFYIRPKQVDDEIRVVRRTDYDINPIPLDGCILFNFVNDIYISSIYTLYQKTNKNIFSLSSQLHCPLACSHCGLGIQHKRLTNKHKNIDFSDLLGIIEYMHRHVDPELQSEIKFDKIGDPSLNSNNVLYTLHRIKTHKKFKLFKTSISTILPYDPDNIDLLYAFLYELNEYKQIKCFGDFSIVINLLSTNNIERKNNIISKKCTQFKLLNIEQIPELLEKFNLHNGEKIQLKILLYKHEIDINKIQTLFNPNYYKILLSCPYPSEKAIDSYKTILPYTELFESSSKQYKKQFDEIGYETEIDDYVLFKYLRYETKTYHPYNITDTFC
jgi:hypothetical protein